METIEITDDQSPGGQMGDHYIASWFTTFKGQKESVSSVGSVRSEISECSVSIASTV